MEIQSPQDLARLRFKGIAQDQGQARWWSLVLKAVYAPVNDTNPACWNYHRREILAYQQGLLADLPGGLLAPRCFGEGRLVRLGYTAACALRWGVVGLWWLRSLSDTVKQAEGVLCRLRNAGRFGATLSRGFPYSGY